MAYKKYTYKKGKRFGPYYYESYRDENGKVKKKYIGTVDPNVRRQRVLPTKLFVGLAFLGLVFVFWFFSFGSDFSFRSAGFAVLGNYSEEVVEQEFDKSIDLKIVEPAVFEGEQISESKNKHMKFDLLDGGSMVLYFDLLNYTDFVESVESRIVDSGGSVEEEVVDGIDSGEISGGILTGNVVADPTIEGSLKEKVKREIEDLDEIEVEKLADEVVVEAEEFEIVVNIGEVSAEEEYKWGYEIDLTDLKFMSRIEVTSDEEIVIYDDSTLRMGNQLLSFSDLIVEGYTVRIEKPAITIDVDSKEFKVEEELEVDENELNLSEEDLEDQNVTVGDEEELEVDENELNLSEEDLEDQNVTVGDEEEEIVESINETNEEEGVEDGNESAINVTEDIDQIEDKESKGEVTEVNETGEEGEDEINSKERVLEEDEDSLEEEDSVGEEPKEVAEESFEEEVVEVEAEETEAEEIVEEPEEAEGSGITGGVIQNFVGFVGRAILEGEVQYENKVVVYIERDFSGSGVKVGDRITLDPTLIIIEITKAVHLNSEREFIEDIYDAVRARDGEWSPVIGDGEYVRVVFEVPLDSTKDITLYARSSVNGSNASVHVYESEGLEVVAEFGSIVGESEYKVFLDGSSGSGLGDRSQDTFDLLVTGVKGGGLEFDWIVDPTVASNDSSSILNNITTEPYPYSHITLNDTDKILYLPFDENETGTVYDYSNENIDGTVGGSAAQTSSGFIGGAYSFNDIAGETIDFGDVQQIDDAETLSVALWVYHTTDTTDDTLIGKTVTGGADGWVLFRDDVSANCGGNPTDVYFLLMQESPGSDLGLVCSDTGTAVADQWTHVAFSMVPNSGSGLSLYVNGAEVTDSPASTSGALNFDGAGSTLQIGNYVDGVTTNGIIDEVMIFNRTLTSAEVSAIYQNSSYRFITPAVQLFENLTISQDGTVNRVNVTTNVTSNFGTYISLRLRELDEVNAWIGNTSWQNITAGDNVVSTYTVSTGAYNVTLEFDFLPDTNSFYSPTLSSEISLVEWAEAVVSGPSVTINFPANVTYDDDDLPLNFNVSLNENGSVIYSLSSGSSNITMSSVDELSAFGLLFNDTNASIAEGGYLFQVYANDTGGEKNYTESLSFSFNNTDLTSPVVTINFPTNTTYKVSDLPLNFNVSLSENGSVIYSLSSGSSNITMSSVDELSAFGLLFNDTNASIADGGYRFQVYANDTAGNKNYTASIDFSLDGIPPGLEFTSPTLANGSATSNTSIDINVSIVSSYLNETQFNWNGTNYTIYDDTLQLMFNFNNESALDENSTFVRDVSWQSHNGTCATASCPELNTTSGRYGYGYTFDAANNEFITVANVVGDLIDGQANWTYMAWLYPIAGDSNIIGHITDANLYLVLRSDGDIGLGSYFGGGSDTTNTPVTLNAWNHFVYRRIDTDVRFFVNGEEVNSRTGGNAANPIIAGDLQIGRFQSSTQYVFDGTMDNIMMWNRSLSDDEIRQFYFMNLYKYNETNWNLEINQSKNTTDVLDEATYTYFASAQDEFANENLTDFRTVTIRSDIISPDVTINFPTNVTYEDSDLPLNFNVSLSENGSVLYSLDDGLTNITMSSVDELTAFGLLFNDTNASIADGGYVFQVYGNDTSGNKNNTVSLSFSFSSGAVNTAPATPSLVINSTDASNQTAQDLHCFANITDADTDRLNATVEWYNDSGLSLHVDFNESFASGVFFANATLDSGNTSEGHNWSCAIRLYDGTDYGSWVNTTVNLTISNTAPSVPTLSGPTDASVTTDRTPNFTWSASTDADGDSLTYELNITLVATSTCSEGDRYVEEINATSHEIDSDLLCFFDNSDHYNWSVRASDGQEFSAWTSFFRVNISSEIVISLPNTSVEFSGISFEGSNDTFDDAPLPFLMQNDGNSFINVTIEATDLWDTQTNPSTDYQFKVDNHSLENKSFSWDYSITTYTNIPASGSPTLCISELNYTNATDSVEIDINITVPVDESSGVRSSTVTFTGSLGE